MKQRTRVKICGITRLEDARHAAAMGADAIGLMMHPPSSRALSLEQATEIRRILPPFVTATAVFLDDDEDWIAQVLQQVKPDSLQFHGNESAEFCAAWGLPYLKAIPMGSVEDPLQYAQAFDSAQGFLLDSNAAGRLGGSGDTFDWSRIPTSFAYPVYGSAWDGSYFSGARPRRPSRASSRNGSADGARRGESCFARPEP